MIDKTAYNNIDGHLTQALATIYGPQHDTRPQFNAISQQLIAEISDLQKNEPDTWERIRRDPSAQRKLVNYFVEQSIPPKARQLLHEDHVRRTPLTGDELLGAFRETKELLKKDPQNRDLQQSLLEIRGQMMEMVVSKNMPGAAAKMGR
jgi:hypothetical protein